MAWGEGVVIGEQRPEDEGVLLKRYCRGEVDAMGELVERCGGRLYGYLVNLSRNPIEADEVFQEVWIRVIRRPHGFRGGNFLGWLFRIGRNALIDRQRRRRPEWSLEGSEGEGRHWADSVAGEGRTPDQEVMGREAEGRVREAVEALPWEQREVFVLRVDHGMRFREIAKVQGVSINTALARMQYAIAKLRVALGDADGKTGAAAMPAEGGGT